MGTPAHLSIDARKIQRGSGWATDAIRGEIASGHPEFDLLQLLSAITKHTSELRQAERSGSSSMEWTTTGGPAENSNHLPELLDAAWAFVAAGRLRPGQFNPEQYSTSNGIPATTFSVVGALPWPN